ncbi:MAG: hypothetical protein AAF958_01920 [Planctomycetota bacterium]
MTVDQYAICPCGTNKKIKFCKCRDSVHLMDEVLQMAQGGQIVPALDRLKKILETNPEAAWALALRGRLLLAAGEVEALKENAERFVRLQPANPLAQGQTAVAKLQEGDTEQALESLTKAISESGLAIDATLLDLVVMMGSVMAETGNFLTARTLAMMGLVSQGFEGQDQAVGLLRSLNQSPGINHLLKSLPELIDRPQDATWGERYDEASNLLLNNKIIQARDKFESLQRVAGREPAVLCGLLHCAIWAGDRSLQCDLLRSLADCDSLDDAERIRFLATAEALDVDSDRGGLTVPGVSITASFENTEAVQMAMTASDRVEILNVDTSQMVDPQRGVPPKIVAILFNQAFDRSNLENLGVDDWPVAIAALSLFGKQTDRDAEIRVSEFPQAHLAEVKEMLQSLDPSIKIVSEEPARLFLPAVVSREPAQPRTEAGAKALEKFADEMIVQRLPERIAAQPLGMLGDVSLVQCAGDDSLLQKREAVCLAVAMDSQLNLQIPAVDQLRQLAGLPPLETVTAISEEDVEALPVESLSRLKLEPLSKEQLSFLLTRCRETKLVAASGRIADRILEMELSPEDAPMQFDALVTKFSASGGRDIESLDRAVAMVDNGTIDQPPIYIYKLRSLLQDRDIEGFQSLLQKLGSRYRDRVEVQQMLQSFLIEIGLLRPDGTPRSMPQRPAEPAGSGLWTPDQGPANVTPQNAPAGPPAGGGSKIILPGME